MDYMKDQFFLYCSPSSSHHIRFLHAPFHIASQTIHFNMHTFQPFALGLMGLILASTVTAIGPESSWTIRFYDDQECSGTKVRDVSGSGAAACQPISGTAPARSAEYVNTFGLYNYTFSAADNFGDSHCAKDANFQGPFTGTNQMKCQPFGELAAESFEVAFVKPAIVPLRHIPPRHDPPKPRNFWGADYFGDVNCQNITIGGSNGTDATCEAILDPAVKSVNVFADAGIWDFYFHEQADATCSSDFDITRVHIDVESPASAEGTCLNITDGSPPRSFYVARHVSGTERSN